MQGFIEVQYSSFIEKKALKSSLLLHQNNKKLEMW